MNGEYKKSGRYTHRHPNGDVNSITLFRLSVLPLPDQSIQAGAKVIKRTDMEIINIDNYLFNSNNEYEIPLLKKDMAAEFVVTPVCQWGTNKANIRKAEMIHFYTDDFRFKALWTDPTKIFISKAKIIVEPNISLFDTTPIATGIYRIFQKRWIARYLQECGKKIFVDLNVSKKFKDINILGVPQGFNAFATRGYNNQLDDLVSEIRIAQRVSERDIPNMIVYGGGKRVIDVCAKYGLIYIEDSVTDTHTKGKNK